MYLLHLTYQFISFTYIINRRDSHIEELVTVESNSHSKTQDQDTTELSKCPVKKNEQEEETFAQKSHVSPDHVILPSSNTFFYTK